MVKAHASLACQNIPQLDQQTVKHDLACFLFWHVFYFGTLAVVCQCVMQYSSSCSVLSVRASKTYHSCLESRHLILESSCSLAAVKVLWWIVS
jgi:hypothetical protein